MKETAILREVETALSHNGWCVIPRDARASNDKVWSVWSMVDPKTHVGVVWRTNTGAARFGKSFVRFGTVGCADFTGFICAGGRRVEIEVKSDKGKLTTDQEFFGGLCSRSGVLHVVVRSYDDMDSFLKDHGWTR